MPRAFPRSAFSRPERSESDVPPHLLADGTLRRPGEVEAAAWRDPEDRQALTRDEHGSVGRRYVKGYRARDPLDALPCEPGHRRAASRLRADWEMGSGARHGGYDHDKVDGGQAGGDGAATQLDARRRYEEAVRAVGQRACAGMLPVVLEGWTIKDVAERWGEDRTAMRGRVMAALDRLAEHYFGSETMRPEAGFVPLVVDAAVRDLPQDRLGRVAGKGR